MMKKLMPRFCINLAILGAIGITLLLFSKVGEPTKRGFFCNDETLSYPYKSSTVPSWLLYTVGFSLPTITVVIIELLISTSTDKTIVILTISQIMLGYVFGAGSAHLITDIGKYSLGRLRPHFFDVCRPENIVCQDSSTPKYVSDYECLADEAKFKVMINDGDIMTHVLLIAFFGCFYIFFP